MNSLTAAPTRASGYDDLSKFPTFNDTPWKERKVLLDMLPVEY
jgi:hypothetical protein